MHQREFSKKANLIALVLRGFSALLCLGALFVPFGIGLESVVASESGSIRTVYGPAFAFFFGGQITTGRVSYNANGVSILGIISYLLAAFALATVVTSFILQRKKQSKWFVLGASMSSLVSAILSLCTHDSAATVLADSILGRRSDSVVATMIRNTTLEFGFWGLALFGFIATAFLLASLIFDGTLDEARSKLLNR